MLSISWCCLVGRCLSFTDLGMIYCYIQKDTCLLTRPHVTLLLMRRVVLLFKTGVRVIQLHIQTFKCGFHNVCTIWYYCICTSRMRSQLCLNRHIFTRRLERCLNGHRTTGIKLLVFMPFHQPTLSVMW